MTTIKKAQEAWKQSVKDHGTHSEQEKAAYQIYMAARQGISKGLKVKGRRKEGILCSGQFFSI